MSRQTSTRPAGASRSRSAGRLTPTGRLGRIAELLGQVRASDGEGRSLGLDPAIGQAVDMLLEARRSQATVMVIGNGGSAAIAAHVHNDLSKAVGVRALAFLDTSLLTALGNDHGYAAIYHRPIELWARAGDVLIAISSSGRSESILRAAATARRLGCQVITISGFDEGNPLRGLGDVNLHIASADYGEVEAVHSVLTHALTDLVVDRLGSTSGPGSAQEPSTGDERHD
jgi:D-sedoheptulose 7-phosphate isomerase